MQRGVVTFFILGESPMIMNRMTEKARQELIWPKGKKNQAQKEASLKHDPVAEYRSSIYQNRDEKAVTRVQLPTRSIAAAMSAAAIDIPGATRAEIERLTLVTDPEGIRPVLDIPLYGIPQLHMGIVRQSGIDHTPDIRTRAIFPEWACMVHIRLMKPRLTEKAVSYLLAAAGEINGIGDDRSQKGGSMGAFSLVSKDDPRFVQLQKMAGRKAQDAAIANPICYDAETEELFSWFLKEAVNRDKTITLPLAA